MICVRRTGGRKVQLRECIAVAEKFCVTASAKPFSPGRIASLMEIRPQVRDNNHDFEDIKAALAEKKFFFEGRVREMKRLLGFVWILLSVVCCFSSSIAGAKVLSEDAMALVKASSSDRVHLRAGASSKSASLGLYFTGTPVVLTGGGSDSWTEVMIGAEKGYMYTERLASADQYGVLQPQWKLGVVDASGSASMRSAPTQEAPVVKEVQDGITVAVLGETVSRWCYVKAEDTYGYLPSRSLHVKEVLCQVERAAPLDLDIFPSQFFFSSGAGAWSTQMMVLPDGSFWGYYHDADMGDDGEDYPNGTLYESSFTGSFADVEQISGWEYQMSVRGIQTFGIVDSREIQDGTLVITTSPYGLEKGELFSVYMPDAPEAGLPEEYLSWVGSHQGIGLYGHKGENGWQ